MKNIAIAMFCFLPIIIAVTFFASDSNIVKLVCLIIGTPVTFIATIIMEGYLKDMNKYKK